MRIPANKLLRNLPQRQLQLIHKPSSIKDDVSTKSIVAPMDTFGNLSGGPLPQPDPWLSNNGWISYPNGVVVGTPTGGNKGPGSVNASGLYINGVAVIGGIGDAPADGNIYGRINNSWEIIQESGNWSGLWNINNQTVNYTLQLTDNLSIIQMNKTSDAPITLTIPLFSVVAFQIGSWIKVQQFNNGPVTITANSAIIINTPGGTISGSAANIVLNSQGLIANLINIAHDTWSLTFEGAPARPNIPVYPPSGAAAPINVSGSFVIDHSKGEYQRINLTANSVLTGINNWISTDVNGGGQLGRLILHISQGGTFTFSWPTSIKWAYGTGPPTLSNSPGSDIYVLVSYDGGSTFYGTIVGQNYQ